MTEHLRRDRSSIRTNSITLNSSARKHRYWRCHFALDEVPRAVAVVYSCTVEELVNVSIGAGARIDIGDVILRWMISREL